MEGAPTFGAALAYHSVLSLGSLLVQRRVQRRLHPVAPLAPARRDRSNGGVTSSICGRIRRRGAAAEIFAQV